MNSSVSFHKIIAGANRLVIVDGETLVDPRRLHLGLQSSNGKVKIIKKDGLYPTLGSLPEQLYGSAWRMAYHVADNPYDFRKSAYRQSKARLNRMK